MDSSIEDTLTAGTGSLASTPGPRGVGLARGDVIGRYVVLAELGAGGMGVVYAAYDPELDRKVALKLLRNGSDAGSGAMVGRARLLREAQALAKFSHPEIVAVHDVGEHQAGVWLAMEFVDGRTLGAWARASPRSWREVLAVMLAAGRGVAAAHAVGLIHRDLKPDNIMIGTDGRVRVMDFGLTRAQGEAAVVTRSDGDSPGVRSRHEALVTLTACGSLLGTPAYMAPEQFADEEVTVAADQFSFCVTLWELVFGERPFTGDSLVELAGAVMDNRVRTPPKGRRVPSWLRRTIQRGLAAEPSDRFASMQALLSELARGQTRARGRAVIVGLGVVATLAVGAEGYRRYDRLERIAACELEGASIEQVWGEQARERVREGLLATGSRDAAQVIEQLNPWLDAQADAWKQHRTQACSNASVEGSFDAATLDRATWCLEERRIELSALITELARGDEGVVHTAVKAAAGLTPISPCLDRRVLERLPAPPDEASRSDVADVWSELARGEALAATGKLEDALTLVQAARERAERLQWPPLVAASHLREATLLDRSGRYPEAEAAGELAYLEAAKASAWGIAADAATLLVFTIGYQQARPTEGRSWAGHAELAISFAGDPLELRAARRLGNLGAIQVNAGEYAEAKLLFEQALAIEERVLGPDHPDVAGELVNLAITHFSMRENAEAKAVYERALAIDEKVLGPGHPDLAMTLVNLGIVDVDTGAPLQAKARFERALASQEQALGPDHPDVAWTLSNLALVDMDTRAYADAKLRLERALAIQARAFGPDHPDIAENLARLGNVELALGQPTRALPLLERAVRIHEAREGWQYGELQAHFDLARALLATGDPERALTEAHKSRDGLRGQGEASAKELATVEAWLAERGG